MTIAAKTTGWHAPSRCRTRNSKRLVNPYTIDEWAVIPAHRARVLDGDTDLCDGVRVPLTPGHTPGHQAVVISSFDETLVIAAQCIFRRNAWDGEIEMANLHGHEWRDEAADSVARLRALKPDRVLLSHDLAIE